MSPALAALAAVTIGGAILAVSARDPRATVLGLLVVLLATPLVADPWPGPVAILARVAGALLAARLLTIGVRGEPATIGTSIGSPAEAAVAVAAGVIGYGAHGLGAAPLGPAEAQAAAFALAALAIAPLVTGRDALRLGVGSMLLVDAALLIAQALDEPATDAQQLVVSVLTIALGGAVAVIAAAARAGGGLQVVDDATTGDKRGGRLRPQRPDADARPRDDRRLRPTLRRPSLRADR